MDATAVRTAGSLVSGNIWCQSVMRFTQNRDLAHNAPTRCTVSAAPSWGFSRSTNGSEDAVSVPSNPTILWCPSQNGLFSECPQRHSQVGVGWSSCGAVAQAIDSPSGERTMRLGTMGSSALTS